MNYLLHNVTIASSVGEKRGSIAISGDRISHIFGSKDGMTVLPENLSAEIHSMKNLTGKNHARKDHAVKDHSGENGSAADAAMTNGSEARQIPFERLAEAVKAEFPECEVIDCTGRIALPGGIDAHVHFREPGMTHKADMESESLAALLGGVTSFIDMPNTNPPTTSAERLAQKLSIAEGRCHANFGFHIGATNGNFSQIERLIHEGDSGMSAADFGGIKVFMGSSTGNMLVDDSNALTRFFSIKEKPILIHSEDETIIRHNLAQAQEKFGEDIPFSEHKEIRSRKACIRSTARALELAIEEGTKLHVLHVSTKEEIEMIRAAKRLNQNITAETSANYLWFDSTGYDKMGSHLKCNPSVKDPEDRAALREALLDGTIDTIGSDHAPHLLEEKDRKYLTAPSGLPSIRQTLPVLLTLADEGGIPLSRIASVFAENAARILGIKDRGYIRTGCYADIVIADPSYERAIEESQEGYRCGWTPYQGVMLKGAAETVFINGIPAVRHGRLVSGHQGRKLVFSMQ